MSSIKYRDPVLKFCEKCEANGAELRKLLGANQSSFILMSMGMYLTALAEKTAKLSETDKRMAAAKFTIQTGSLTVLGFYPIIPPEQRLEFGRVLAEQTGMVLHLECNGEHDAPPKTMHFKILDDDSKPTIH